MAISAFNEFTCAVHAPAAKDGASSSLEEIMHVTLVNSSKYDFFISMKQSGTFVLNAHARHNHIGSVGEVQFFARCLPSLSFTQIPFYPADFLKNTVARIWLAKEGAVTDFYYKDLIKKSVMFLIQPKVLSGLRMITICVEGDKVAEYMYHNFTEGYECWICKRKFTSGETLTVLDCGCAMHQECYHGCGVAIECSQCHNLVAKHEFQDCPCIFESKFFLGPISLLINDSEMLKSCVLTKKKLVNT